MRDYVAFGLFHSTHVHISVSVINKKSIQLNVYSVLSQYVFGSF